MHDEVRINESIKVPEVRVVGADGENLGIMPTRDAFVKAQEAGFDLIEVSPKAKPPVARIADYGKYKYEQQKKAAEARKARTATVSGETAPEADMRPEMSGPMADYIGLHRHAVAQASLIRNPAIAMRLMAAHALCGSSLWNVRLHWPGAVKEATLSSVEGGSAAAELVTAREGVETLFEALGAPVPRRSGDAYHLCESFAALLAMSDAEVLQVMALAMAETLDSGGPVVEVALHACGTDLAEFWKPDEAFFDLLRDKRVITAFIADAVSPETAREAGDATTKAQKAQLAEALAARETSLDSAWLPGWMHVPPMRHLDGAACPPADAWNRIAGLFEADAVDQFDAAPSICEATVA